MGYTDLTTIHDPALPTPNYPPAAWATQVRDNDEALAKPYRVRVRRTTAQSIPNGVATPISWDTQDYDTSPLGDLWVPGAPTQLVLPVAGVWMLALSGIFAINATGARILWIQYLARTIGANNSAGNATWYTGSTVSGEDFFPAGAIIRFMAYQASGGALDLAATAQEVWASARLVSR